MTEKGWKDGMKMDISAVMYVLMARGRAASLAAIVTNGAPVLEFCNG